MGTSTRNDGQKGKTPLIPTWANDDNIQELPSLSDENRFRAPRGNYTRFLNDKGMSSSYLRKATSQYVKSSLGGAKNAVIRLGSSRESTVRLLSIFNYLSNNGIEDTGRKYQLGDIKKISAQKFFIKIIDFVCPNGGSVNEGIARDSYIETLLEFEDIENRSIDTLSNEELRVFMEKFMANVIHSRLLNDIGNKSISLPEDVKTVEFIQEQIEMFISGAVNDAIHKLNININDLGNDKANLIVNNVYEEAYNILSNMEE